MALCNIRSTSVTLLLFAAATVVIAASGLTVEVKSSRDLRLAIVDGRVASPARHAVHQTLVAGFRAALNRPGSAPVGIRTGELRAFEAKSALAAGDYDAVLVIADDRPLSLRRLDAVTFCGELDPDFGRNPVYLIVANTDLALRDELAHAFNTILADRRLLKSLDAAANGTTVAALTP